MEQLGKSQAELLSFPASIGELEIPLQPPACEEQKCAMLTIMMD
jgi:hypothetical protein